MQSGWRRLFLDPSRVDFGKRVHSLEVPITRAMVQEVNHECGGCAVAVYPAGPVKEDRSTESSPGPLKRKREWNFSAWDQPKTSVTHDGESQGPYARGVRARRA